MLYLFAILPINEISKAYMKDAVFFIFGILAVAVGVAKTGLDKRIGLILLSRIKSAKAFAFVFLPMLALSAGFLSEHALVALLIPVLMGVYKVTCKMYGVKKDRALAIFLLLGVCFAANHGGPGSPAAGGRNAIMVGYLADYGMPITFLEWMKTGVPFVPVMSWVIGLYMYLRLKPKFLVKNVNPSEVVKAEVKNMPKFGGREAMMAVILVLLVAAWIIIGEHAGLGGPTLYAVMAMFLSAASCAGKISRTAWPSTWWGFTPPPAPWAWPSNSPAAPCGWPAPSSSVLPGFSHQRRRPGDRREPAHRHHDQLHERRCHGGGPGPHRPAHGHPGQRERVEGGADHLLLLFVCQFSGGGNPQQCHLLRHGQGSGNR
jgi:hypothetical protein